MNYYLIGIKGSGMSALACILKDQGNDVSGSDIDKEVFTQQSLDEHNIKYLSFDANNINNDIDRIIVGNAFNDENIEVQKAIKIGIDIIKYTDYLNEMTNHYKTVAISGTNGKTTTTSLVDTALQKINKNTLIGDSRGFGSSDSELFILEACEYKGNFLKYNCDICLINNIDMDHPDFFTSLRDVQDIFVKFANKADTVILNIEDEPSKEILEEIKSNVITFGINKGDVKLANLSETNKGYHFDLVCYDKIYKDLIIPFVGIHMLYNTLATYAICYALDVDILEAHEHLITFKGAKRRFEITMIDEDNNIFLVDDYAHHPTSVKMTLDAVNQRYKNYFVTTIFQAHTYSRALEFGKEFAAALNLSDRVLVADIFGSIREQKGHVDKSVISDYVNKEKLISDIKEIDMSKKNHVIVLLGAGDIDKLYKNQIIKLYEEKNDRS